MPELTPPSTRPPAELLGACLAPVATQLEAVVQFLAANVPQTALPQTLELSLAHALKSPGKLLRPALTLLCWHLQDAPPADPALVPLASVSEMIHVATLLHDDVLDESDKRRGKPTVRSLQGNRVSILAGDWLLAAASRTLADIGRIELVRLYSNVLADLCTGELLQDEGSFQLNKASWAAYERKTYGKTASLFSAACVAAGWLAHASPAGLRALECFGERYGMAFQLIDDLLDYQASEQQLGKPVLADLRLGLINAPILLALQDGTPPQQAALKVAVEAVFQAVEQDKTGDGCAEAIETTCLAVKQLLEDGGWLAATQQRASHYAQQASQALAHFAPQSLAGEQAQHALLTLAESAIVRTV